METWRALVPCLLLAAAQHSLASTDVRRTLRSTDLGVAAPGSASPGLVAGMVGAALTGSIALALIVVAVWRRAGAKKGGATQAGREKVAGGAKGTRGEGQEAGVSPLLCLTFNDVQVATEGFKPEGLLSDKPHSSVHRGEGPGGERWAVKRAKGVSLIGEHLFRNEVDFLAKVVHPHILTFQAFSDDCSEQILIFEYMPNGSLASWLRPPPEYAARPALSFNTRVTIALGIAEALCFLHSFSKPTIIHRDVVSESVLLDSAFRAKLGSLGLLKHLPGEGLWMRMAQKKGYLDPEYFQTFKVTAKCDVYSFGVVMLELLSACPPVIQVTRSETQRPMTLPQWASQSLEAGQLEELLDARMPRTEGGFTLPRAERFAQIANECVAPLRKNRPEMVHVVTALLELKGPTESSAAGFFSRLVQGSTKVAPV